MAAEMRQARALSAIRTLRAEDARAVADILRQAPEAVFWPEASVSEVLQWPGVLAIGGEASSQLTGFLIARQAGDAASAGRAWRLTSVCRPDLRPRPFRAARRDAASPSCGYS